MQPVHSSLLCKHDTVCTLTFESQSMMEGLTHVLVTVISILRSELAFNPFGQAAGAGPE